MVLVTNLPDNYAGDFIAEKYGTFLTTETSWKNFEAWFPQVLVKKVSCNEVFVIENALHNDTHGFLTKGFSPDVKFYVLSSSGIISTVIQHGDYEEYSSTTLTISSGCLNN